MAYSPSNYNFYGWTLDADGCAKRDDQGREAPPDCETLWYSPRADFWCVWGYGFADEDECDAAVDRAIANVRSEPASPAYIRGGGRAADALA